MIIPATADLGLLELRNRSPLVVQLLPSGALFALRHGETLINQLLPGPAEDGLFRLLVRWRDENGGAGWARLVGPGLGFTIAGAKTAVWETDVGAGLRCTTVLHLHPRHAAWVWRVRVHARPKDDPTRERWVGYLQFNADTGELLRDELTP